VRGVIEEANQAAAAFFGVPRGLLVGKPLPFFVVPQERGDFYVRLVALAHWDLAGPGWEVQLKPRQGPPRYADVTVTAAPDEEGQPRRLRWLLRDVTARREAQAGLSTERHFSEVLLAEAEVLVLVLDDRGRVRRSSAFTEAISGYMGFELLGRPWWDALLEEPDRPRARAQFEKDQGQWRAVYRLRTREGVSRVVQWASRSFTGVGGAPTVLLVGHDITELEQAQRHALEAERLATIGRMAAGMAHESRNTLQRSHACLALLRWRCEGRPDELDLIGRLEQAQRDLQRLYEDVREYGAPIHLDRAPCELSEVWREVWANLAPRAGARLQEQAGGVDLRLVADAFRLRQVFRNLFENALEAAGGDVRIEVACAEAPAGGRPALRVAVRDDGPGLAPAQRQRLFEPLYTTKARGSGLGLAIVKRIVEAHGGSVAVGEGLPAAGRAGAEISFILPRSPT
jgi:PAS domain S-box-containing protein